LYCYTEEELTLECDYEYEKQSQLRMKAFLKDDPNWNVPDVIEVGLCRLNQVDP
jgi:predicted unusual protein kinase regulating ubiquinone biosynthesis (AarF/ABC1/UbiB family)